MNKTEPDRRVARRGTLVLVFTAVWLAAASTAPVVGIWAAIGGAAVTLGVGVVLFDRVEAKALLQPTMKLVLVGAIAGVAMTAVTHLLYPVVVRVLPWVAGDTAQLYALFRAPSLVLASVVLIPVIVGEDLVWRGIVQTDLVERLGARAGVGLATLAYALAHAPLGSPVLIAAALGCGLVWSLLRAATGSLVPVVVAHVLWDFLVLLLLPLAAGEIHTAFR